MDNINAPQESSMSTDFSGTLSLSQIITMEVSDFFNWWYVKMPILYLAFLRRLSVIIDDNFSISLLLKTFFIPWKRDATVIGLFMGIIIRLLYLPIAIITYCIVMILALTFVLSWIFIPILTLVFIILTPFLK